MSTRPRWMCGGAVADYLPSGDTEAIDPQRGGWTFDDLLAAGRAGASRVSTSAVDWSTRADVGWSGAALHFVENPDATFADLCAAAQRAVADDVGQIQQMTATKAEQSGHRFAMFWYRDVDLFRGPSLEYFALAQVWEALPEKHRHMLLARAQFSTDAEMGAALGVEQTTVSARCRAASEAALRLWFDHEAPPDRRQRGRSTRRDTHCRNGHRWDANTQWTRSRGRTLRRCAACNRDGARRAREKKVTSHD